MQLRFCCILSLNEHAVIEKIKDLIATLSRRVDQDMDQDNSNHNRDKEYDSNKYYSHKCSS